MSIQTIVNLTSLTSGGQNSISSDIVSNSDITVANSVDQNNISSDTNINAADAEVLQPTRTDAAVSVASDTRIQDSGYVTISTPNHLITFTTWNQTAPYNNLCPTDPISKERCVVGCVATATAQILYFWKHTTVISFSSADQYVSKQTPPKQLTRTIRIDQDSTTLDFPNFTTMNGYLSNIKYDFSDQEKAVMSFAAGIMTKMDYSSVESGAYSSAVAPALKKKCGYASAGEGYILVDSQKKIAQATINVLADNIANGRPIFAATSGHAVVIDGYNSSNQQFHVNLGWGGESDGWYTLDAIANQGQLTTAIIDIAPTMADAVTYYVTTTEDYGVGSLRRAIEQANNKIGKDTIVFDASLMGQTITLTTGEVSITDACIISGLGAGNLTISGGWTGGSSTSGNQIFSIINGGNASDSDFSISISNLTLSNGYSATQGGAILNKGLLSLANVTVTNCGAKNEGGGIYSEGSLTLSNTNVTSNQSFSSYGGGINVKGTVTVEDSIITGNVSRLNGGGIFNDMASQNGRVSYDTLISGNTPNNTYGDLTYFGTNKLFTGDFNGDKIDEVLRWKQDQRSVAWVSATSAGNWTNVANNLDPSAWQVLGTGDFNGDKTSDILLFNKQYNTMGTWLMNNGAISSWSNIGGLNRQVWNFAGVGDFNGDGTSDILMTNTSGQIGAWIIKDGTYSSWTSFGVLDPSQWSISAVGDFNGDKTSDVLLANSRYNLLGAWLITNGSASGWSNIGNVDLTEWSVPATGDINGDGITDILLQDKTINYLGGWLMNSQAQPASWAPINNIDLSTWKIPATGSFQGNGTSDILLSNSDASVIGEWKMKNGVYDGWVTLATS